MSGDALPSHGAGGSSFAELLRALADEPAVLLRDGGVIAPGVDAGLDELRAIGANCDAFLLNPTRIVANRLNYSMSRRSVFKKIAMHISDLNIM